MLEDRNLDDCLSSMADLLADDAYPARCAAASLTPQLYPYFSDNQARAQPDSGTYVCAKAYVPFWMPRCNMLEHVLCTCMHAFLHATL